MPQYTVQDTDGKTLTVSGDSPPTEAELNQIFQASKARTSTTTEPAPQPIPPPNTGKTTSFFTQLEPTMPKEFQSGEMAAGSGAGSPPSMRAMTPTEKVVGMAREGLRKAFPGVYSGVSPFKVLGGASMLLPFGVGPETTLGKALLGYFGYQAVKSQPAYIADIKDAIATGQYTEATRKAVEDTLQLTTLGMGVKEAVTPVHPSITPLTDEALNETVKGVMGSALKMPQGSQPPTETVRKLMEEGVNRQDAEDLVAGKKTVDQVVGGKFSKFITPAWNANVSQINGGHAEAWISGYQNSVERLSNILESERPNAKTIRSDTGQSGGARAQPEGGKTDSGGNVQQAPSGAPNATGQKEAPKLENLRPVVYTMDGGEAVGDQGMNHEDIINRDKLEAKDIDHRAFKDITTGQEYSRKEVEAMGVKSDQPVPGAHAPELAEAQKNSPSGDAVELEELRAKDLSEDGLTPEEEKRMFELSRKEAQTKRSVKTAKMVNDLTEAGVIVPDDFLHPSDGVENHITGWTRDKNGFIQIRVETHTGGTLSTRLITVKSGDTLSRGMNDAIKGTTRYEESNPQNAPKGAAARLNELKAIPPDQITPEEVKERDALQAKSDSVRQQMQGEMEKLKNKGATPAARPIKAFHFTTSEPFDQFDPNLIGSSVGHADPVKGFYLTANPNYKGNIPEGQESEFRRMDATVSLKNPLRLKSYEDVLKWGDNGQNARINIEKAGYDGVIFGDDADEIVAFHPDQIKFNKGATPTKESQPGTAVSSGSAANQPAATDPIETKYRVGKNPTLHTLVERLPQSEIEKANGEQPVRVRNDKTGETQTVMESDLTPVKAKVKPAKGGKAAPTPTTPPAEKEMVGMGGAVPGEFEGAASTGTSNASDVFGIAERVREARAEAGEQVHAPIGEGINWQESVEHGRELLNQGADPEKILSNFEQTRRISADDIAIVRAHGERLAQAARRAEIKYGTNSEEYNAAKQPLNEWVIRSKAMQTEWHRGGQAQQGETDIDTGSFTGMQIAHLQNTGEEFTPSQKAKAENLSDNVHAAEVESEKSKESLSDALAEKTGTTSERKELKKAQKAVRDSAVAMADAENKQRIANTDSEKASAAEQAKAAKRAFDAANKTVREAAVRLADAETKARVKAAESPDEIQNKAAQKALKDANEVVAKSAKALADAENKRRVAASAKEKAAASIQEKASQRALKIAQKVAREAAIRAARAEAKARANPEIKVWDQVRKYLDENETSFDEIRNKVATDLGMPVNKVTELMTRDPRVKRLADDAWRKQQDLRRLKNTAKRWLSEQALPGWQRAISRMPRTMFALRVGFHGWVALGTHAPMVAFQPEFWGKYFENYARMYKMVGNLTPKGQAAGAAYYEMQIQDLLRRPNYITARRAGLVNDPYTYEDFNNPKLSEYLGPVTGMGNRGYSVLKFLRQDMFDQLWDSLPKTSQIPEVAKALANDINHSTGVTKSQAPKGAATVAFAPRLLMSRGAWLAVDPAKAIATAVNWRNAPTEDKIFAMRQVKSKASVVATAMSLLAINQGILMATKSKQRVNLTDPMRSDFLKFKAAGMDFSYGNAMLTMARLPMRLWEIRQSDGGKLKNLVYPDESSYSVLGEYARSQESPFASLLTDLWMKADWQNRPLPSSNRPIPKRLRAQGVQAYTWPEFWSEQALPIPFQEAAREVWRNGFGMDEKHMKDAGKALFTTAVMGATGGRVVEDTDVPQD